MMDLQHVTNIVESLIHPGNFVDDEFKDDLISFLQLLTTDCPLYNSNGQLLNPRFHTSYQSLTIKQQAERLLKNYFNPAHKTIFFCNYISDGELHNWSYKRTPILVHVESYDTFQLADSSDFSCSPEEYQQMVKDWYNQATPYQKRSFNHLFPDYTF